MEERQNLMNHHQAVRQIFLETLETLVIMRKQIVDTYTTMDENYARAEAYDWAEERGYI